jgi:hypothetical protein
MQGWRYGDMISPKGEQGSTNGAGYKLRRQDGIEKERRGSDNCKHTTK